MDVKSGDIILTRFGSYFSTMISRYGQTYFTHANFVVDKDTIPELSYTNKSILSLEELLNQKNLLDIAYLDGVRNDRIIEDSLRIFSNSTYESLNGLRKIYGKGFYRDLEDISTDKNRVTCSSYIGKCLARDYPFSIHSSQLKPDDFLSKFNEKNV